MQTRNTDELCARLCLLTHAAWNDSLPPVFTRPAVHRMIASGALSGLILRDAPGLEQNVFERARMLLSRVSAVYALAEAYTAAGYRPLLPGDPDWPRALYKLGHHMPLFLFARGNRSLAQGHSVAVAGSRDILPETALDAKRIGRKLALEGLVMVSGGARGVDSAAQAALFEAGGSLILVPARPAGELVSQDDLRYALEERRLLLLCDTLPDEPFSPAKALARNHTIYALGDAAIVVAAREGKGGSWRGATDCLRGRYTPVFALEGQEADKAGNGALLKLGARPLVLDTHGPLETRLFAETQLNMMEI